MYYKYFLENIFFSGKFIHNTEKYYVSYTDYRFTKVFISKAKSQNIYFTKQKLSNSLTLK